MDVTAEDLLPLVAKLSPEERARLSRMALLLGSPSRDAADALRYQTEPVRAGEFESIEDPLAWDADGWDGFE
ncbi:MAG: hypothetical protein JNK60_12380 [Acidobacteria bacterium]|nr:hypothetical protein [Acidobacteriota bacterium]